MVHVNQTDKILKKIYKHPDILLKKLIKYENDKNFIDAGLALLDFADEGFCGIFSNDKTQLISVDRTKNPFIIDGDWRIRCTRKGMEYVESKNRDFRRWFIPLGCALLSLAVSFAALIVSIVRA